MTNPFDQGATATAAPAKAAATAKKAAPRTTAAAKPQAGDGFDGVDESGSHVPGKAADPFSAPPGISEYKITDFLGETLLVEPTEVIEEMDTEIGTAKDVVRANVVVLTGENQGLVAEDVLVFQMALKRSLLRVLDGPNPYLLGTLALGSAKKGKNAPYIFQKADDEGAALARQWVAANPRR
ncbi:hypothetical protein PHLYER_48 [Mycobacterium phage Phlyer]|uniref:gp48 n=1 Tax=Mycobacterium phage Phlyer TaxID=591487 RepID=UPI000192320B|nr:gp48 [Mycobacterium phage Phlyer]ACM42212.1 hypothetical protein PHLYER_48 [Mycobacterium phage Phlyer]